MIVHPNVNPAAWAGLFGVLSSTYLNMIIDQWHYVHIFKHFKVGVRDIWVETWKSLKGCPFLHSTSCTLYNLVVTLIGEMDTPIRPRSRELDAFGSWRLHRGLLRVWQLPLTYCSTYIYYLYTWLNGSCQTISKIPLDLINQTHLILVA